MAAFNKSNLTDDKYYSESDHSDYEYSDNEDLLSMMEGLQLSAPLMPKINGNVDEAFGHFANGFKTRYGTARARAEREQLKAQLEADYEASKEQDRLKMEERAMLANEKRDAEEALAREAADTKRRQEELIASMPAEPDAKDKDAVTIKLRFPDNSQVIRRFFIHQPLQLLVDFAGSCGYLDDKYRMFTSDFPRKNVATLDRNVPFRNLKWSRREQVIVEEI